MLFTCSVLFGSVRFQFWKQNFDQLVLFGSGRSVKHCFGRSLLETPGFEPTHINHVLLKMRPSQIDTKMLSWISIRFSIRSYFPWIRIDIIQQKTLPRRYFPFLLFTGTFLECTFWGSTFGRWISRGKLNCRNWASTQRANKRVKNILKVQIMFEQLIKHWFMANWHENIT